MQIKKFFSKFTSEYTVNNFLVNIYIVFMFTVFPLYMSEYYGRVRRDKFFLFVITTVIITLIIACSCLLSKAERSHFKNKLRLNITDYAFVCFISITVISTITTNKNIFHCIVGYTNTNKNAGRNMGLIMFLLLFIMYLIISRLFVFKKFVFYAIFIGISAVTILAILNYYYIDPLDISQLYKNEPMVLFNFTSTLGNKNYFSAFVCVALPFSVGVAMTTNDILTKVMAHISTAIQFMGLIVATSDGGFLGLFALIFVLLIIISRDILKLAKLFFSLTVMMLSANMLRLFDLIMKGASKGYLGVSAFLMRDNICLTLTLVCALLTVFFVFIYIKAKIKYLPKAVLYIALCVAALVVLTATTFMIYYTFIDKTTKLSGLKDFFRFNDNWGTHRGFFWIRAVDIWKNDFNLWQKLFGSGPETFYYAFKPYFTELYSIYGEGSVNAAHNVYINMLITHGILGVIAYISFIISAIINAIKKAKNNSLAFICLLVILAYSVQDFVNIANPINAPLFMIFMALSRASLFYDKNQKEIKI